MSNDKILAALKKAPGSIAQEVGATPVEMNRLEKAGAITRVGKRKTGSRGRPPVEWAVAGAKVPEKETTEIIGLPKLVDADAVRPYAGEEEARQLRHIEGVFDGKSGTRELGDYRILADRYREIVRQITKRVPSA